MSPCLAFSLLLPVLPAFCPSPTTAAHNTLWTASLLFRAGPHTSGIETSAKLMGKGKPAACGRQQPLWRDVTHQRTLRACICQNSTIARTLLALQARATGYAIHYQNRLGETNGRGAPSSAINNAVSSEGGTHLLLAPINISLFSSSLLFSFHTAHCILMAEHCICARAWWRKLHCCNGVTTFTTALQTTPCLTVYYGHCLLPASVPALSTCLFFSSSLSPVYHPSMGGKELDTITIKIHMSAT